MHQANRRFPIADAAVRHIEEAVEAPEQMSARSLIKVLDVVLGPGHEGAMP